MGKWMDLAEAIEEELPRAISVISANSRRSEPIGTIGAIGTEAPASNAATESHPPPRQVDVPVGEWDLPALLVSKLKRLGLKCPRPELMDQHLWAALVCDTVLFAKRGWAAKAMALGWSELELFGIAPKGWQGLTSRLIGREVLGLDARIVAVKDGRSVAHLPRETLAPGAVPIWEAGKL